MRSIPTRFWLLSLISALLQILPFPIAGPVPLWRTAFCWICLTPLLYALVWPVSSGGSRDHEKPALSVLQSFYLAYFCGIVWYLGNCYWIYATMNIYGGLSKPVSAGILLLFSLYLGLYHGCFGVVLALIRRNRHFGANGALLISPFIWVTFELARARITTLPWDLMGITQVDHPMLTRLAPYTGAYGISFVILLINALFLVRITVKRQAWRVAAIVVGAVVLGLLARNVKPASMHPATAVATLVQHNLGVGTQMASDHEPLSQYLAEFSELSEQPGSPECNGIPELPSTNCITHASGSPTPYPTNIVIWPESPAPLEGRDPRFLNAMTRLAQRMQAPMIIGNLSLEPNPKVKRGYDLFNSATFFTPQGEVAGRYDKIHLVPFGEYTPYKQLFFFAGDLMGEVGTFDFGYKRTLFASGGHKYGTFICYESIFGDEVRQFTRQGADVLVNISNDGWYGDTSAPWQHLNMVRMRAIENHRWVIRSTNTGVTSSIDPTGRVVEAAPRHIRTGIRVPFGYETDITFYVAHGDVFAWACVLITFAAALSGFVPGSKAEAGPPLREG